MNPRNPWSHAKDRSYLTPEDIEAAIMAGGTKLGVWGAVLGAIQSGCAEDVRLCAFSALQGAAWTSERRHKSLGLLGKTCPECGSDQRAKHWTSYYDKKGNHDHMNAHVCKHAWHRHASKTGTESEKKR